MKFLSVGKSLTAQLTKFDINTSKHDILTMVSAFNPFPKKATKEFLVSRISHPMTNPACWIKYLATDQIFYVHQPLSYEIKEFTTSPEQTENKVPNYSGEMWMTLDQFISSLSHDLVSGECFFKANLDRSIERSVISYFTGTGLPMFLQPQEAHLAIVKEALKLIDEGDLYTAYCFVDFASRTGAYVVKGHHYSEPSYSVFEYTGRDLAWKACPSILFHHMAEIRQHGKWNIVNDTASEVQSFIILSINLLALNKLVGKYTGTAREHIQAVLIDTQDRLRHVAHEKLARKHDALAGNYLDQAMQYLHRNGINL